MHLRLDDEQKALSEAPGLAVGVRASTFVLGAATDVAADVLADRRMFLLDEDALRAFDEALQRPAEDVAGLRELLDSPTVCRSGISITVRHR